MGTPVKAKVTELRFDHSRSVNGKNPWVVVAEYQDDELTRRLVFTGQYLWSNPQADYPVGGDVTVSFLPQKPSVYEFDFGTIARSEFQDER